MYHNWFQGKSIKILQGNKYIGKTGEILKYNWDGKLWNPHTKEYGWYMWKVAEGENDIVKLNNHFNKIDDRYKAKFMLI